MSIAIFSTHFTQRSLALINNIIVFLKQKEIKIYLNKELSKQLKANEPHTIFSSFINVSNKPSFFISIGGDGTILESIARIGNAEIPVIGINMGRLGFLSIISKDDYKESLDKILSGNYKIESRTLLSLKTENNLYHNLNFALNEITVSRKN